MGILTKKAELSEKTKAEALYKSEQARMESDLRHSKERNEELLAQIEAGRKEAAEALMNAKNEAADALANAKNEAAAAMQKAKEESEKLLEQTKEDLNRSKAEEIAARDKANKEAMDLLQQRFDETMAKVTAQVKSDTADMLKAHQKEFTQSSNLSIGQIVDPLKQNIVELKKAMEDGNKEMAERNGEMRERIKALMEHSDAARKSADELAAAFKHGNKIQGDWGETILEELLASNGLTKGIHFDTQAVIRGTIERSDILKGKPLAPRALRVQSPKSLETMRASPRI